MLVTKQKRNQERMFLTALFCHDDLFIQKWCVYLPPKLGISHMEQ